MKHWCHQYPLWATACAAATWYLLHAVSEYLVDTAAVSCVGAPFGRPLVLGERANVVELVQRFLTFQNKGYALTQFHWPRV